MKRNLDANVAYLIAFLAFALSYTKLVDLADRAGYGLMAYAWPLIVDGLAVMAARGILRLSGAPRWYARGLLLAGTAISILAAILNAMVPPGPLPDVAKAAVWIVPALCLPFAYELARKLQASHEDVARQGTNTEPEIITTASDLRDVATVAAEDRLAAESAHTLDAPLRLVAAATRPGKYTAEQKAEALRLVAEGMSQREAGRRIGGAPGNTVKRWLQQSQAI